MLPSLTVGSTKFAPSAKALVSTLFDASGTASGLFRIRKNGVLFSLPDGEPFAFLVANNRGERFFVSAGKQRDGRTFYSFGLSDSAAVRLGLAGMKYSAQQDEAVRVWQAASNLTAPN